MRLPFEHLKIFRVAAAVALLLHCLVDGHTALAQTPTPAAQAGHDEAQRGDIYSSEFTSTRPAGKSQGATNHLYRIRKQAKVSPRALKKDRMADTRRVASPMKGKVYTTVGVTIGRGRPATVDEIGDAGIAKVQLEGGRYLVFERSVDDQPVTHGSLIQMTIEYLAHTNTTGRIRSNQIGYLYVINRVRFSDDRPGTPRLIFPTPRINHGDNRVMPGKPVMLPDPNRPWQVTRSQTAPVQAYETYVIIVSPEPLKDAQGFELRADLTDAASLEASLDKWTRLWGGGEMQAHLKGGAGRLFTRREQAASGNPDEPRRDTGELDSDLTQDDLPPQTIFRKVVTLGEAMLVTVELPFRNSAASAAPRAPLQAETRPGYPQTIRGTARAMY